MCTRDLMSLRGEPKCPECRKPISYMKLEQKNDYYFIFMAIECFERALGAKSDPALQSFME
jgi:hypothetical protein